MANILTVGMDKKDVFEAFLRCCNSKNWARLMTQNYPFATKKELHDQAITCWKEMERDDILEAFRGHPMIGADLDALRKKFQQTSSWSEGEQAGMKSASEESILALQKGNQDYLEKFGYIFIVCATGKSADEMLALLLNRLPNHPDEEIHIAALEQQKITAIRLEKLLMSQQSKSPITTHILDTHRGCPASGVSLELRSFDGTSFVVLAQGVTNDDGRVADLLTGKTLSPGIYQMHFDTAGYHASIGIEGFYPEVVVTFEIKNTEQHYHIPLLLSPFGYSTYRGS